MRRAPLAIVMTVALAGCAGARATPPVMPTIADVATTQSQLASITDPQGFFRAGAAQIMANCGTYFDQLVAIAQRNGQNAGQVTAATQALSAILGLAQVAPAPISIIGVVGPAVTSAIANAQAGAPGGDHPAEMGTLIAAQMNVYLAAIGAPPSDAASAWMALYGLFRTCSSQGIEAAKQQALADAPNHLMVPAMAAPQPAATAAAVASRAPGMGIPQVIIRTPPPAPFSVPMMVSRALPEFKIRERLSNEHALIQRYGRNRVEGGPQTPPSPIAPPAPSVELAPLAPPAAAVAPLAEPMAVAPLPPSPPSPPKRKL